MVAYNKMAHYYATKENWRRGDITSSCGNHAFEVAVMSLSGLENLARYRGISGLMPW